MDLNTGIYWIWFSGFPFLKLRARNELIEALGGPEGIFNADEKKLSSFRGINSEMARIICSTGLDKAEQTVEECSKQKIDIITLNDPQYPFRLKNIYSPPSVLYVKGKMPDIDDSAVVAVIGTRKASQYGLRMGKRLAFEITGCGGVVVSLLTAGVDHAAAEGALLAGGTCIGVLGTSHELEHSRISDEVAEYGALVSEYPPGTVQSRAFFRDRIRIAAGLSLGAVVVEAPEKSGTRFFVSDALEQGKDIYAVPGNADSANSKGTLELLKMGAKPVATGWDVISEYAGIYPELRYSDDKMPEKIIGSESDDAEDSTEEKKTDAQSISDAEWIKKIRALNDEQKALIFAVENGASRIDEIIEKSGFSAPKVLSNITILEIRGIIIRDLSGNIKLKKHF